MQSIIEADRRLCAPLSVRARSRLVTSLHRIDARLTPAIDAFGLRLGDPFQVEWQLRVNEADAWLRRCPTGVDTCGLRPTQPRRTPGPPPHQRSAFLPPQRDVAGWNRRDLRVPVRKPRRAGHSGECAMLAECAASGSGHHALTTRRSINPVGIGEILFRSSDTKQSSTGRAGAMRPVKSTQTV
jgi:hypothetical protein